MTNPGSGQPVGSRRRWRRGSVWGLVLAATAAGVAPPAGAQEHRERHHWIVLLDVSGSFDQLEREQNREMGRQDYRLRDETLTLVQTLLAAQRVRSRERRDDKLSVYVFGADVKRLEELTTQPVRWAEVNEPSWWAERFPTNLGARTDYFAALDHAAAAFALDPDGTERHLVLISDGELDVGSLNRAPGTPPAQEEMDRYDNRLRRGSPALEALKKADVRLDALAIDPALHGANAETRQRQVRHTLSDFSYAGDTDLDHARALVRAFQRETAPGGRMPESEGPYVLAALASYFDGAFRPVRYDNVLDTLWQLVFPGEQKWEELPMGTRELVVFAPHEVPVPLVVGDDERTLSLVYDEERDDYRVEPPGPWPELRVDLRTTAQYAVWLVRHPELRRVITGYKVGDRERRRLIGGDEEDARFSVVPVTNLSFEWQAERPPGEALSTAPIPLTVDLVWHGDPPEPTRDDWREELRSLPLPVSGEVELPDGSTRALPFSPIVPGDDSNVVLRLTGELAAEMEGRHEVRVSVRLGDEREAPELKAEPVRFHVLDESPLSDPNQFQLHLRRWAGGQPAEALHLPRDGVHQRQPIVLKTDSDDPVTVLFEWWGRPEDGCQGIDRLHLSLPDFGRSFDREHNEAKPEAPERDGDRVVCYRSPGVVVEADRFGETFTVEAGDGLVEALWWRWQVTRPSKAWLWALLALAALLLLALVLFLFRKPLVAAWMRRTAVFPLALDVEDGTSAAWQSGAPRRLLLIANEGGQLSAEVGTRRPSGTGAVEVVPVGKRLYRVRVVAQPPTGEMWTLQRIEPKRPAGSPHPLTSAGEEVSLYDLANGQVLRLALAGSAATLRYQA